MHFCVRSLSTQRSSSTRSWSHRVDDGDDPRGEPVSHEDKAMSPGSGTQREAPESPVATSPPAVPPINNVR
uniref:Uncharacterized protein n=1 Tax=Angiostrongylus cantonensis TaxID=6313 RepID=A0A0K0DLN3_ANGCA